MSVVEIIAGVMIGLGILLAVIAAIGINRFQGVLMRLHPASKPQALGLVLVFAGTALVAESWNVATFLLVVLLAQMLTIPVASTMLGRAAFRRGFVRGGDYSIDELTPRLASDDDEDDDEDGFLDESDDDHEGLASQGSERFPENVVGTTEDALTGSNWGEPEVGSDGSSSDEDLDVDLEDETEREAEEVAERDRRR